MGLIWNVLNGESSKRKDSLRGQLFGALWDFVMCLVSKKTYKGEMEKRDKMRL